MAFLRPCKGIYQHYNNDIALLARLVSQSIDNMNNQKIFKIALNDDIIEIPYKKDFFFNGYRFIIHRPTDLKNQLSKDSWTVSEYGSGLSLGSIVRASTIDKVTGKAMDLLNSMPAETLTKAINNVKIINQ